MKKTDYRILVQYFDCPEDDPWIKEWNDPYPDDEWALKHARPYRFEENGTKRDDVCWVMVQKRLHRKNSKWCQIAYWD